MIARPCNGVQGSQNREEGGKPKKCKTKENEKKKMMIPRESPAEGKATRCQSNNGPSSLQMDSVKVLCRRHAAAWTRAGSLHMKPGCHTVLGITVTSSVADTEIGQTSFPLFS